MANEIDLNDLKIEVTDEFTAAEKLLAEWFNVWLESDELPVKLTAALHVRTATYFASL